MDHTFLTNIAYHQYLIPNDPYNMYRLIWLRMKRMIYIPQGNIHTV